MPCRKPVRCIQGIFLKNTRILTMQNKLVPMKSYRELPKYCSLCLILSEGGFPESFSAGVCHYHIYRQIKETFRTGISLVLRTIFIGRLVRIQSTRTQDILLSKQRLTNNIFKRGLKLEKTERGIKNASGQ